MNKLSSKVARSENETEKAAVVWTSKKGDVNRVLRMVEVMKMYQLENRTWRGTVQKAIEVLEIKRESALDPETWKKNIASPTSPMTEDGLQETTAVIYIPSSSFSEYVSCLNKYMYQLELCTQGSKYTLHKDISQPPFTDYCAQVIIKQYLHRGGPSLNR